MSGTIELDRDGKHLLVGFPYREDLVDEVRNMPGRRFDRGSKMWRVPIAHAELVVTTFMKHGFEVAGDVMGVVAGTGGAPPAAESTATEKEAEPEKEEESAGLTISQLNERARSALRAAFPRRVTVIGEVVDFDKNRDRSHIFFSLVEKDASGRKLAATVDAALFERTAKRVLPAIEQKGMSLRDGIQIMVEARVDLYPANGRFQLIIEDIKPEFTLGKLALSREQILAELREAGIDQQNAMLPWPLPTLRIGVLTSPTSDGWNDFLKHIESSGIGFDMSIYPVRVQGEQLKPTMLTALEWFEQHHEHFDVLCILRGGGSKTDLAWFDDRDVAFAVAKHPVKVVCGIGHERDKSVLDEIAASQKTPTAVAGFLVGQVEAAREVVVEQSQRLREFARARVATELTRLSEAAHGFRRVVHGRIVRERTQLESAAKRLAASTTGRVFGEQRQLHTAVGRLQRATEARFLRETARLDTQETRRRLLDPAKILQRGYAMVKTADGRIVTEAGRLKAGDKIDVALRDGRARSVVEDIQLETD